MATFTEEIEQLVGNIPSGFDTNLSLREGVEDVIEQTKRHLPTEIFNYAQRTLLEPGGTDIIDIGDPIHVDRRRIECQRVSPLIKFKAQKSTSLHYRTAEDPAYFVDSGVLHTIPDSEGASGTISAIVNATPAGKIKITASSAHNLITGDTVILSGTSAGTYDGTYEEDVTYLDTTNFYVSAVYSSDDTQGAFQGKYSYASLLILGSNTGALKNVSTIDNFPQNRERAVVLYASKKVLLAQMGDLHDDLALVALSYSPEVVSLPNPDPPVIGDLEAMPTFSVNPFTQVPSITLPTVPELVTIDVSGHLIEDTSLAVDVSSLTPPTYSIVVPPPTPNFTNNSSGISSITEPVYSEPAFNPPEFEAIKDYIQVQEDIELAQAQLQDVQMKISQYQADTGNNMNKYQKEVEVYKAKIQEALADLEQGHKVEVAEYQSKLAKYQADVTVSSQEFSSNLSKYQQEVDAIVKTKTQNMQLEIEMNKHNASMEVQSKSEQSQQDIANYGARVSALVQKNQSELQANLNAFKSSAEEMTSKIQYTVEANKVVNERSSTEVQLYGTTVDSNTKVYQADIQRMKVKIDEVTSKFQNFLSLYQSKKVTLDEIKSEYFGVFGILPEGIQTKREQQQGD